MLTWATKARANPISFCNDHFFLLSWSKSVKVSGKSDKSDKSLVSGISTKKVAEKVVIHIQNQVNEYEHCIVGLGIERGSHGHPTPHFRDTKMACIKK